MESLEAEYCRRGKVCPSGGLFDTEFGQFDLLLATAVTID